MVASGRNGQLSPRTAGLPTPPPTGKRVQMGLRRPDYPAKARPGGFQDLASVSASMPSSVS